MHLHQSDATCATPPRPFVLADVGPDGRPTAMLITPTPETVLDRAGAAALITELLAVLSGAGAVVFCWAASAADTAGQVADALAS